MGRIDTERHDLITPLNRKQIADRISAKLLRPTSVFSRQRAPYASEYPLWGSATDQGFRVNRVFMGRATWEEAIGTYEPFPGGTRIVIRMQTSPVILGTLMLFVGACVLLEWFLVVLAISPARFPPPLLIGPAAFAAYACWIYGKGRQVRAEDRAFIIRALVEILGAREYAARETSASGPDQ
jgi:hypothetical protein